MPHFDPSTNSTLRLLPRRLGEWVVSLSAAHRPDSFALVMATGIISNALFLEGYRELSTVLFYVNTAAYPWLAMLTILRAVRFPQAILSDLTDPRVVFSFFTLIAANGVFGAGLHLRGVEAEALELWLLSLVMWFVLVYLGFGVMAFRTTAPGDDVVHGGWLLAIVGTESLVILGALAAPLTGEFSSSVFVLIHMLWGVGIGLYAMLVTLIAFRIFYLDIVPDDLTPILWVVMGAAAISTNAGSTLLLKDSGLSSLDSTRPFIEGVTLILWAWAAWWIPLLLLFGVWKHGVRRMPVTYTPMLWGIVFPLGMYALASLRLSLAADFPPLRLISLAMLWISVAAWAATFIALAAASWRSIREFSAA